MAATKRNLIIKSIGACAAMVVLLFVAGVVVGYLSASGRMDADGAALWVIGLFAVVAMGMALWIGLQWMRAIDEAAQEAHKWAWYWGGSSGLAVGGALVIMAGLPHAEAVRIPAWYAGRTDPAAYAATGAFAMLLLMLIGYAVAWAWWWLARR